MKKFIVDHEQEVLLLLVTILGVTRWWLPPITGFPNLYPASHWVLSYDYGLVRRGLIGSIIKLWLPMVTVEQVYHIALVAYCTLLALLLVTFYALWRTSEKNGRLFRLFLFFAATPVTLSLFAHDLGRFDLFLTLITVLSLILLSLRRYVWMIPVLTVAAMFVHEGFLVLYAPTIVAAILFVHSRDRRGNGLLVTAVVAAIGILGSFVVLYRFGYPTLGYEEFSRFIQSRADFHVTELSMRECYYGIKDHLHLTSPYLHDAGSIVNLFMAILMLSPAIIILLNLWTHALRNSGEQTAACKLFFLATLSGLLLLPVATDYGRWLSAIISCNFFAVFLLLSMRIIKVEELEEYSGGYFPILFITVVLTYLLFGPLHDWNPYPYSDNILYSSLSVVSVLLFDIGFCMRWRTLRGVGDSESL